jgi:hypothetical protein
MPVIHLLWLYFFLFHRVRAFSTLDDAFVPIYSSFIIECGLMRAYSVLHSQIMLWAGNAALTTCMTENFSFVINDKSLRYTGKEVTSLRKPVYNLFVLQLFVLVWTSLGHPACAVYSASLTATVCAYLSLILQIVGQLGRSFLKLSMNSHCTFVHFGLSSCNLPLC